MTNLSSAYINALLADASYVDLAQGQAIDDPEGTLSERMTPTQAKFIADNFQVASTINTSDFTGSGFDATVWRGKAGSDYAGQTFVSMRGTEPGVDLWGADADLAVNVAARSQIIDMVNWWLRESTPAGTQAQQVAWNSLRLKPGSLTEFEPGIVPASSVPATGNLVGVTSVQVNGHSLGGHLASAFTRIFGGNTPDANSVRVEKVTTFNSAGFNGDNSEPFFSQLQQLLGTGLSNFDSVRSKQSNFFAENGIEVTTNTWWFTQMGTRIGLGQEESTGSSNHYMYKLTDLLALGAAMEKLDPSFSFAALDQLI